MANPIYTYQDKQTNNRYFLLWDTIQGFPKTIPINLLTFLQYWGIYDKEKISALYSIYPRLIETGTSLKDSSFNEIPDYLKKLCFDCLEVQIHTPSDQEFELNQQLEDLFACDLTFFEFYAQYVQLVSEVNRFPRRPKGYYLSWSRTLDVLNISKSNIQGLLHTAAEENGIHTDEFNFDIENIYSWFEHNVFKRFPKVMVDFFVQLAQRNLIAIDAIPHVMRNDQSIQDIFTQFGMESFLPDKNVDYNLFDQEQPVYELVNDDRFFRQFVNLLTFDGQEFELIGLDLLKKTMNELNDTLSDSLYIDNLQLVNLKDSKGNYLLPIKYTNDFQAATNDQFLFLSPFGRQAYHVVHQSGTVIDTSGYYDFHITENIGYMQYSKNLSWIRWSYDEETNAIDKQPVSIDDPYQEGIWELTEERFQQALMDNNHLNERDKFELLELEFEKQDDQYSIYLAMPNKPSEDVIKSEIIFHLNQLLEKGIDLSNSFTASFALYKSLRNSKRSIKFSSPILNTFYVIDNLDMVTVKFLKNYHNEDFLDELRDGTVTDRSELSPLSLILIQDCGHYSEEYHNHFKSNVSLSVFLEDCEEFVNTNPFTPESDLEKYANLFLNYLLEKGYKQVNVFVQNINKHTIKELLSVELNYDGCFEVPEDIDDDDDDDLPF